MGQGCAERFQQLFVMPGLDNEIRSPFLQGAHRRANIAVGSDHDDGSGLVLLQYPAKPVETLIARVQGAFVVHVQENDVEGLLA